MATRSALRPLAFVMICAGSSFACSGSDHDKPSGQTTDMRPSGSGESTTAGSERDAQSADPGPQHDGGSSNPGSSTTDAGTATHADGSAASAEAGLQTGPLAPFEGEGEPWTAPAPRATCGAGDKVDGMLSGLSEDLHCNLEIIGQVEAPHFLTLAWYKDCAYVNGSDGTTVIQVAPDGTPKVTTTLTELGFRANWESMKASAVSGLLVGYEANGSVLTTYDLSKDCAQPELASSITLTGWLLGASIGHAGSFSPDGTIYYASSMYTGEVFAVDLTDAKKPKLLTSMFERGAHDLFVGKGGTRGYFAVPDVTQSTNVGSFAVMDLTQVQARAPDAKGTVISELTWEDGTTSQYPILITYGGKDYLFINDELGAGAETCDDGKPVWGYGRIFDMADEKKPKLVSLIKTEAHDPKNCKAAVMAEGGVNFFGVSTHYCNVDRLDNPRLLSCGLQAGGVRMYDIRNPWRPKEVAYFSWADEAVPGMQRIHVEKRELWLATQPGKFYVMKFPKGGVVDQILSN